MKNTKALQASFFAAFVAPHYEQPHRDYHSVHHIGAMLHMAETMGLELTFNQRVAIWFHDAVYVPGSQHNEVASALLMETVVCQQKEFIDAIIKHGEYDFNVDVVSQIILDTQSHKPTIEESKIVLDLDMAILGTEPVDYQKYVQQVRFEFKKFEGPLFDQGRAQFLRSVIGGRIFHTELFHNKFDAQAQANLQIELATL